MSTSIWLQKLDSIQPRTSPPKFFDGCDDTNTRFGGFNGKGGGGYGFAPPSYPNGCSIDEWLPDRSALPFRICQERMLK